MKWDHKTEDLTDEGISTEMVERIRAGVPPISLSFSEAVNCLFQV